MTVKKQLEEKELVRFDWAIKYLLRNKVNFNILEGFLSELLKTDVTIMSLLESESNATSDDDKSNRVDLLARFKNGEHVIIEVQCIRQWDYLSRMLYGVSKVVVENIKRGETYGVIPRVIAIHIVYFDLGEGDDYIYHGTTAFLGIHTHTALKFAREELQHYPESVQSISNVFPEYYLIKVDQFDSRIKDKMDEWIYVLRNSAVKPEFQAKGIAEANKVLDYLKLNASEKRAYDRYMDAQSSEKSMIQTYFSDGLAKGLEEGIKEGIKEGRTEGARTEKEKIAKTMRDAGFTPTEISKLIGLPENDIESI